MTEMRIRAVDEPIRADQYLYISTHGWEMGSISLLRGRSGAPVTQFRYLAEHRSDQWVPADRRRDWLIDRRPTGRRQWVLGSEEQARAAGYDVGDPGPVGRFQAPRGDFDGYLNGQPGCWQIPDPAFLRALPRDPEALLARLDSDSPDNGPAYCGPFTYASDALRSGLVPADLRAALYQALMRRSDVGTLDGVTDLDGHACVALVHEAAGRRRELLINPQDGQYAGRRDTRTTDGGPGLGAGTVTSSTRVRTAVVDTLGEIPPTVAPRDSGPPN
ncbi:MAG TPA: hypothetical protein VIY28_15750 [Pseudonocardiaceae bacterium]